ncbi:DUF4870 domain-containing protein [Pediococcus ethanolidurans]|uniref:Integral membrane protein n=1 Tax=Pediococcus ethanolidurans TaxID=319653 RepID=A0A1H9L5N8_9LACO|nr:DUF4870 domain-containing protein [Pediococcus ethanolidurans]MBU7554664.1 DUF4870 domain-containing protein [Pediococcus ethanolidurans]MBU7563371.1 DUF4870 domain-containing protein [Pediococcus ethanolidurans]MCT4399084.1 DUF4870 domain-containing protein [Pediococcus ethanolidurans]MCV3315974.1 DUF4870 domain-containing protein [Pediococcus ethanolidurans]MCV3321804.1 DUF4870 domain-containing protein [Pediococcus ethanolidurans]
MTTENKILSSLSYLSILFLPVLFPLIVWILTSDRPQTRHYAANALIVHLFPALLLFVILIIAGITGFFTHDASSVGWMMVFLAGLFAIVGIGFFIYSIYKGIKILVD